jgi:ELWxxDGT repeat protein
MSFHRLLSLTIFGLLATLPAPGQAPAYLVRDINVDLPRIPSNEPWYSLGVGSLFYFSGNDGSHGNELWRSDGTPAGTFLLKDVRPGAYSSWPSVFTRSNGLLFFSAGQTLWKSDGTPEGTSPVEGAPALDSALMIDLGGELLFFTKGSGDIREIWGTDGTPTGTHLVAGAAQGFYPYSAPRVLAAGNGQALFAVWTGVSLEPWVTDGTGAGTHLVADLNPGGSSIPYSTAPGNKAVAAPWGGFVFVADDGVHGPEIWKTDGTAAGTSLIEDLSPGSPGSSPFGLTAVNGKVVFAATDSVHGTEIWVTDGTPAGTLLLQDVWPGSSSSDPRELTAVGSQVFFRAADGTHGAELWATDGTPAGTRLVKDLAPGAADAFPPIGQQYVFTPLGGHLIFYSPTAGATFWTSDGTAVGTQPFTPSSGSWPSMSAYGDSNHDVVNGRLFFQAGNDQSLWVTDGTTVGSYRVLDIRETPAFRVLDGVLLDTDVIAGVGGTLFFQASGDPFGYRLWRSDGTAAGTWEVKDTSGNSFPWYPDWLHPVNGRLAFRADSSRLALSDGTAAGTGVVPGSSVLGFAPKPLGNELFFFSQPDSAPQGLWKTDGTEAGTVLVSAHDPFFGSPLLAPAAGKIFYALYNGTSVDLWVSDGTGPGTDIGPGLIPSNLTDAGDTLFFISFQNALYGATLWKSDGTAAGTVQVKELTVIPSTQGTPSLAVLPGGVVLFVAGDGTHGEELWRSDGNEAGTMLVKDIRPGPANTTIYNLTAAGGRVFFTAEDGVHGQELWTSDGTETGTHLVRDIVPGAGSSFPYNLAAIGSTLVFSAYDEAHGVEAWRSDGTEAGTWRLADIAPGPLSSSPMGYTLAGNKLFFVANDNATGFELWAIPKSYVTGTFTDVPPNFWAWRFVEALAASGVTGGCGGDDFCPGDFVNRAQMAVFVLTARGTAPPPATGARFDDVPPGYWAGPWIEELANEGVVGGCSANPPLYCPNSLLTRAEMAVLLTLARGENPPPATGTRFADVPAGYWAARFIEQLAADGVTGGCGGGNYCPDQPITRGEMAVFLATAFHLPLP